MRLVGKQGSDVPLNDLKVHWEIEVRPNCASDSATVESACNRWPISRKHSAFSVICVEKNKRMKIGSSLIRIWSRSAVWFVGR